jgi:hypothetical protein
MGRPEWESALKLSTIWEFTDIRDLAIRELSKMDIGVDAIMLGREYSVASLLLQGCVKLAKREETISTEDGQMLGWETAIQLFQVREAGIKATYGRKGDKIKPTYDYESRIRSIFAQQLADAEVAQVPVDPTTLSSTCVDNCPLAPSKVERNGKFYMENIIFLVGSLSLRSLILPVHHPH